jgi:hypothetical protein
MAGPCPMRFQIEISNLKCQIANRNQHVDVLPFGGAFDVSDVRDGRCNTMSEVPCRVSSDVHERRNDLGAVSTADSVKLKWR